MSKWVKRNRKVLAVALVATALQDNDWGLSNIQWMAQIDYVHPTPLGAVHGFWWFNVIVYLRIWIAVGLLLMVD